MAQYVTNLPVNGDFNITATFGQTGKYWSTYHKGIDITASQKDIYSVCDGEVTVVGWDENGWGRYVSVRPKGLDRIRIIVCHLVKDSVKVKKGDSVNRLTRLGKMGATGNCSGVHVHIEMRIDNTPVCPSEYLLIPNKKCTGLKSTNFKFDASCQKSALSAVLQSFDQKKSEAVDAAEKLQEQITTLQQSLKTAEQKIADLSEKIANAKKALG